MGPTAIESIHLEPGEPSISRGPAGVVDARLPSEAATPTVRLELQGTPTGALQGMLDGAWWPHSRDLVVELPSLISELLRRGREISRVSYHPETWKLAPRAIAVDGHSIKLGWFHSMDPHLLTLTGVYGAGRLDLLVVPPDSSAATAARLMAAANEPDNRRTASAAMLAAADEDPNRTNNVPVHKP
jgi:hypothetical protein